MYRHIKNNLFIPSIILLLSLVLPQNHTNAQCTISNVNVDIGECIEANYYSFTLNFNISENPSDYFDLYVNDEFYAFYHLDELPITIEEFAGNPSGQDTLRICANDVEDCCAETIIMSPCPCDFFNIESTIIECNEDSIWFNLDFEYLNVSDSFLIGAPPNGFLGTHHLNELPLNNLVLPRADTISVLISDQGNIFCFNAFDLFAEDCDMCSIQNVKAEAGDCNDEGLFFVTLEFEHLNTGGEGFSVRGNGNDYGDFEYDYSHPLENGFFRQVIEIDFDFTANCETIWEFVVSDNEIDGCSSYDVIGPICCDDCSISEINVYDIYCINNSFMSFFLDFDYENPNNDFFEIFVGGEYFGTYPLDELPIQIIEFPVNPEETSMTICINDQEDCCNEYIFSDLDCGGDCEIFDLVVDGVECISEDYFEFWLNFEYINPESEYFNLFSGQELIASYQLNELPVFVEEFPVGDGEHPAFTVCIPESEECCYEKVLYDLDCEGEDCEMSEIDYDIYYVSADSFLVQLDFEVMNPASELFSVRGNGNLYGHFKYESLPVILGIFDCRDSIFLEFIVRDLEKESCFSVLELGVVDCLVNTNMTEMSELQIHHNRTNLIIQNYDSSLGASELILYNQVGQKLKQYHINGNQNSYELMLPNVASGMYYVHIFNEKHRTVRKLNVLR